MDAIVSTNGEVANPSDLRRCLGTTPNTVLDFREENGNLVAVKVLQDDPVRRVMECLQSECSTDEIIVHIGGT